MIVLYQLIAGPNGDCGIYGHTAVDEHPRVSRWWGTLGEAELEARVLCERIGPRPRPGIQHTRPIPVIVVERTYENHVQIARGTPVEMREVHRVWALADGTVSETDPVRRCPGQAPPFGTGECGQQIPAGGAPYCDVCVRGTVISGGEA